MMDIIKTSESREALLPLLLVGDEQQSVVEQYMHTGDAYVLRSSTRKSPVGICLIVPYEEDTQAIEIKNIAIEPDGQGKGYGRYLLEGSVQRYAYTHRRVYVGTGAGGHAEQFYRQLGFVPSHTMEDFFIQHYDHPIYENDVQLKDMIYYVRPIVYT